MDTVVILTSAVVATAVGAAITWFSNHQLQRGTFKNEYHKQLIAKRLKAYETVENLNKFLMQAIETPDGRSYPLMFHSSEKFVDAMALQALASHESVWLSDAITDILGTFNRLILLANSKYGLEGASDDKFQEAGIGMYDDIVEVRHDLHYQLRNDFKDLHKIDSFISP